MAGAKGKVCGPPKHSWCRMRVGWLRRVGARPHMEKKVWGFFLEGFEHVVFLGCAVPRMNGKKELKHKPLVPLIFKNKDLRQAIRRWVGQGLASGATYILNYNDDIDDL